MQPAQHVENGDILPPNDALTSMQSVAESLDWDEDGPFADPALDRATSLNIAGASIRDSSYPGDAGGIIDQMRAVCGNKLVTFCITAITDVYFNSRACRKQTSTRTAASHLPCYFANYTIYMSCTGTGVSLPVHPLPIEGNARYMLASHFAPVLQIGEPGALPVSCCRIKNLIMSAISPLILVDR